IRNLALKIIADAGCIARDKKCQAIALGSWVQDNVYYVHEMPERFQLPDETLRLKAGDCDDATTLVASLLEAVGIPAALVCMRVNGAWAHIFPSARLEDNSLMPLDTTQKS